MSNKTNKAESAESKDSIKEKQYCGIIMPISPTPGYPESHWQEVELILNECIDSAGFKPNIVSNSSETTIIHKTIVKNLYDYPIVVCDISSRNPNVMFELGMRLTFDKPTIIIKDDKTEYSFDTSIIEHLPYPSDLRYQAMVEFKKKLTTKIIKTFERASDPEYSTFLKSFGSFEVPKLSLKEVPMQEFIIDSLKGLNNEIHTIKSILNSGSTNNRKIKKIGSESNAPHEIFNYLGDRSILTDSEKKLCSEVAEDILRDANLDELRQTQLADLKPKIKKLLNIRGIYLNDYLFNHYTYNITEALIEKMKLKQ